MNSSVESTCHCLGLAPCPPPFFYLEFEDYAINRSLIREEICEIASRCMSKYPTENSSLTIERICSPPTEPNTTLEQSTLTSTVQSTLTSTVQSTLTSTVQSNISETPNTIYHSITTESSSIQIPSSTPFTPALSGCNATCIALIVCFLVVIIVLIFVIILICWYRKQCVLHLDQIKRFCKKEKGDHQHIIVCENARVNYVKMDDEIDICIDETNSDNNLKKLEKKLEEKDTHYKHDAVTSRMKMQFSNILTQGKDESNDSTTDTPTFVYENTNFTSVECDTFEESSDDEVNINANKHGSETGSMITHVSSTLILDNVEFVQTETFIHVDESIITDATDSICVPRDNSDVVEKKDDVQAEGLDLKCKIDSGGEKGNDKKEADVGQGLSIDNDKNKKHTSDIQQQKSDEADVQRRETADDYKYYMNIGPDGENQEILQEDDERILKCVSTETITDAISHENVEADADGEKGVVIDDIGFTEQQVQYSVTSME